LLGLLEAPDSGEVWFEGQPTAQMTDDSRAALRTRKCGYVFASPFLLSAFTVLENIAMPIFKVCQLNPEQARDRTEDLMEFTGLGDLASAHEVPQPLRHRVALARALASQPTALFVENLDTLLPDSELEPFRDLLHGPQNDTMLLSSPRHCLNARRGKGSVESNCQPGGWCRKSSRDGGRANHRREPIESRTRFRRTAEGTASGHQHLLCVLPRGG
jgi:lipoprotein-releasing system ATP-binding protein